MKVGTLASIFPTLNQSELLHVLQLGKAFLLKTLRLSLFLLLKHHANCT